jgi:hypothetical protein
MLIPSQDLKKGRPFSGTAQGQALNAADYAFLAGFSPVAPARFALTAAFLRLM